MIVFATQTGNPRSVGNASVCSDLILDIYSVCASESAMITSVTIGEKLDNLPDRPSLIIRKVNKESLWEIAKQYRTEPEAIQKANMLDGDPEIGSVLLIPIR